MISQWPTKYYFVWILAHSGFQLNIKIVNKKHRTKQLNIFCMIIDESQAVGDTGKEEGTKEGDQEEKQEKGVGNEEETMENGDKGGKKEYQLE